MLFEDTYLTIEGESTAIFSDRGSKFIASAYPITSDADIKPIITQQKLTHPKANHHCWALRLSADRTVFKISDDGEPSGTAGRPILNVLLSKNLTNIAIVVTRYFGGILLGVPGLINAYRSASEEALKAARIIEKTVQDVYSIDFDYLQTNSVMTIVKDEHLTVLNQQFSNDCRMVVAIRKQSVNQVVARLRHIAGIKLSYDHTI